MKKRSKYRPRPVLLDTINFVKVSVSKVTCHEDASVILRTRINSSLKLLKDGKASPYDIDVLASTSNSATSLKRLGKGKDWAMEIRDGTEAIAAVQARWHRWRKVQATPAELAAIELLVDINDAQLNDATVKDINEANQMSSKALKTNLSFEG